MGFGEWFGGVYRRFLRWLVEGVPIYVRLYVGDRFNHRGGEPFTAYSGIAGFTVNVICLGPLCDEKRILSSLNHEWLHIVLARRIGRIPQASQEFATTIVRAWLGVDYA
ncbi:MAG: hypothetical protein DRP08_05765 [Candidatus Aenigmatarchaeota archaeon]|nr:MAG: hypothetical protein DRP08_05765 [Candidatus Aenigmarchaeota archaeon]